MQANGRTLHFLKVHFETVTRLAVKKHCITFYLLATATTQSIPIHSNNSNPTITHHFVDGRNNLKHLLSRDVAVAIEVVHGERPLQLLLELAPRGHTKGTQKLSKVNTAIAIGVKSPKDVLGKF